MAALGLGIVSSIIDNIGGYFKGKQELKKVKLAGEIATIQAEVNAKVAVSEAKIHMAKNGQVNDFNLDLMAMKNMEKSYKDEFLLLLFSVPMVMAFLPGYSADALTGFKVVDAMPEWYQYTFIGMIVVIYGMRGMLNKVLDGKKLGLGKSKAVKVVKASTASNKTVKVEKMETKKTVPGIIVHCSDSPQGRGDDAATIDRWHKERGWSGIGYHYVILEDGTIQDGRPLGKAGAHAKGYNKYVGICLIGKESFTDEQFNSLEVLIKRFDTPREKILGHYAVSKKTCPNFDVEAFKTERQL